MSSFREREVRKTNVKSFKDFGGTWAAYTRYLNDHGELAPGLTPVQDTPARPAEAIKPKVQWYGKQWLEFTEADKQALRGHLYNLGEKANAYRLYLHHHFGMPKDFQ